MPRFLFHLQTDVEVELDRQRLWLPGLESAYLEACASIPDLSAEFITAGRNPIEFQFLITTEGGALLMEVPFGELFRQSTYRASQA